MVSGSGCLRRCQTSSLLGPSLDGNWDLLPNLVTGSWQVSVPWPVGTSIGLPMCDLASTRASDNRVESRQELQSFIIKSQKWSIIPSAIFYWVYTPTLVQCRKELYKDMNTRGAGSIGDHLGIWPAH